nr:immunoglobulin light chain junction region [Macaca mulatta]MOX69756.1 immunoglobulin light chain junction region [Macaca mulatta]MOX70197.1 immunoglobulin light chain junction region [Macaca mulatta]MOX70317.1 immunoglobulin light chain junction region [Macaca mulatta]MOX70953.1 immunoglobulin light chain junction region [Macaca mulatta]
DYYCAIWHASASSIF